jgi:hypothetical protein
VREWADNSVVHVTVSDVGLWWDHIESLDLPARYGVKIQAPRSQGWAVVAGVTDPSGVLWRFAETRALAPLRRGAEPHYRSALKANSVCDD